MSPITTGPPHVPTDLDKERASSEVTEAVSDQLKSTRATADAWQKGLAGLLGVVTSILLLKGRDSIDKIEHQYVVWAAILLAIAALFAVISTYLLLDAAHGQPAAQDLEEIRRKTLYVWRYDKAIAAAKDLRRGQYFLLATLLLVASAVILTWFAPSPSAASAAPAYQVVDAAGHCGQLSKATNGRLKLIEDDKSPAIVIIKNSELRIVRTCPE